MIKDLLRFFGVVGTVMLACVAYVWWTGAGRDSGTTYASSPAAASAIAQTASNDAAILQTGSNVPATGPSITASVKQRAADSTVVKVNGEAIAYGEVRAGIGRNMFGLMVTDAIQRRLEVLIRLVAVRQYLKEQGVKVADEDVEREVTRLRLNPPAAGGCPCCSFNSLDAFLAANFLTMNDLLHAIHNDMGMNEHVTDLWNADFPPGEKRGTLTSKERPRIERDYERMSHIFFNTAQQPDFAHDPDRVRKRAKEKALDAWQRLQKGEDFAKVARERSEDSISRPKGGSLGYVQKGIFGNDVEKAFEALKPDEYSQPIESPWGFHIVRRGLLTEQDVLDILRGEYESTKTQEIDDSIRKSARIERIQF